MDKKLKELVKLAQSNDQEAHEELFNRFENLYYKQSFRYGYFDTDCFEECSFAFYQFSFVKLS